MTYLTEEERQEAAQASTYIAQGAGDAIRGAIAGEDQTLALVAIGRALLALRAEMRLTRDSLDQISSGIEIANRKRAP